MSTLNIPRAARYRKRMGAFTPPDVKHDKTVMSFSSAVESYNFDCSSGALRCGYGVESHEYVPAAATRYWVYRFYSEQYGYVDQYVYQLADGRLKFYDTATREDLFIAGYPFPPITALNYRLNSRDVLIISAPGQKLVTWNGTILTEHEGSPTVSSMALHYERLFVTSADEPTKVFFSDDLDPTAWDISADGGGFIELLDERGALNKVASFGNYLYIFRDHGISRVTAFGDQKEFSVVNLFVTAGRIYPDSIAVCGGAVVFLASDGLYRFDGYDCVRILQNLDGLIDHDGSFCSAYFDGKYYLSCRMAFASGGTVGCEAGEYSTNGLLVYDVASGEHSITRGVDISFMAAATFDGADFLMCCDGGRGGVIARCGMRFDTVLPAHWQSAETDFGTPDKIKFVREAYIKTSTPVTVSLCGDGKKKSRNVKPNAPRVRFNYRCDRTSLAIDSDGGDGINVSPPTIVYG